MDALKERFRLFLIDARGHGRSDKPRDAHAYGSEQIAADVVAALDAAGVPKAHFLVYSYGNRIALAVAKHYPERALSMILGGGTPLGPSQMFDRFIEVLDEGAAAIADVWDAPVSPTLRARLDASDVEALIAICRCRQMPHGSRR